MQSLFTPSYAPSSSLLFVSIFCFLFLFFFFFLRWRHPKDKRLPPGSMGWPYIGETLKLYTENPNSFFSNRQKRYGDIFKTHILGCPCVMISSPEAAKLVLYAFDVAMISAFGNSRDLEMEGIKNLYHALEKGYNSMPLNLPGTPFHKAMKARKLLNENLRKLIQKKRESGRETGGLLGILLGSEEDRKKLNHLTDAQIADNIIGVIFAAHDTTASVLTWVLKYLHDNRDLLDSVAKEQDEIRRRIIEADRGLTWDDTRSMPLTTRVIQETLRTASILSFTFREAVEDIEFEGYLIPTGWKVLPLFRTIHHSEDFFPHPQRFDPSRFEVPPRPNTYMPFGNGVHSCPGSELAKLEMLLLLHHLTTSYSGWRSPEAAARLELAASQLEIGDGKSSETKTAYSTVPFPVPKGGLPVRVYQRVNR
ncbi:hypothetical protein HYC85_031721 [Camellia sinensis]|uniref:Uncharacterized protein n=1 Tax=Camellia sinensis TaxID=4442 RepID=A0A7J7FT36_CAMSI|nr:hypothetical protein HYC85_031721 [Camellia sinensis]